MNYTDLGIEDLASLAGRQGVAQHKARHNLGLLNPPQLEANVLPARHGLHLLFVPPNHVRCYVRLEMGKKKCW